MLSGKLQLLPLIRLLVKGSSILIITDTLRKSTVWYEDLIDGVNKQCDTAREKDCFVEWKDAGSIIRVSLRHINNVQDKYDIVLIDKALDPLDIKMCQTFVKHGGIFITVNM